MNIVKVTILALGASFVVGCAEMSGTTEVGGVEMGEKTKIGAATGGAMGAGLGAIIGNQTGSTGTGLAIGALAGATTGGVVGNVFDSQEKTINNQDAAINKQEQALRAQGNEIETLRRSSQDSISFRGDNRTAANTYQGSSAYQGSAYRGASGSSAYGAGAAQPAPLREASLPVGSSTDSTSPSSPTKPASGSDGFAPRLSNDGQTTAGNAALAAAPAALGATDASSRAAYTWSAANKPDLSSPDCVKSQTEVKDAAAAAENADKLFHYRRAIRLCPNNPEHHNSLGQVYLSLNRKSDAEFEFKEALNVDSSYEPAKQNLSNITR